MAPLFGIPPASGDAAARRQGKVPAGQYVTEKFPVLTYGAAPRVEQAEWRFQVVGLVEEEVGFGYAELLQMPATRMTRDFHCVTGWSRLDNLWEGVRVREVLALARPTPPATHVMLHCYGNYTTNLPLATVLADDVLLAYRHDGKDLERDHGGPVRLVVPSRYGWKSAKWVRGMELLRADEPGFWESLGYHMNADYWKEERFGSPFLP